MILELLVKEINCFTLQTFRVISLKEWLEIIKQLFHEQWCLVSGDHNEEVGEFIIRYFPPESNTIRSFQIGYGKEFIGGLLYPFIQIPQTIKEESDNSSNPNRVDIWENVSMLMVHGPILQQEQHIFQYLEFLERNPEKMTIENMIEGQIKTIQTQLRKKFPEYYRR
jgi:hypothetical protein